MKWKAALYGRVSTDHSEQQESIKIQEEALAKYAVQNGYEIGGLYFDEGFSGTSFDRPEIERLKNDIEGNRINLVIVKDLSRIGRNNALTLSFLDYLNNKNVRLIAINDSYDSLMDEDDLVGIKTWYNERYSKDLSKKIKFALKHKKGCGEYLTAFAPYGYRKSLTIKNKLEIDSLAADVVKEIYNLYINGFGFVRIANILDERGIPNPSRHGVFSKMANRWNWTTIRGIISNPVYMGCSVQQKYCKKSFKSKNISKTPEKEWIWVNGTHEPIIEKERFELAQRILKNRKTEKPYRSGPSGPHLFTSFLYCHECGSALYYKKGRCDDGGYRCGTYVKYGSLYCSSHYIREDELVDVISDDLRNAIHDSINPAELEADVLQSSLQEKGYLEKELNRIAEEIARNKQKIETLYRDRLNSIISENMFMRFSSEKNCELQKLEAQKSSILRQIDNASQCEGEKAAKCLIDKYLNMAVELDREMVEWLINRIDVCSNGDIIISYNFVL